MKKLALIGCLCVGLYTQAQDLKMNGAWKAVKYANGTETMTTPAQSIIKLFRDGYWIVAHYGAPEKPFDGACGGTYKTDGNRYVETVEFFSWDSTTAGQTYTFDYAVKGNKYRQDGKINYLDSDSYIIKEEFEKLKGREKLKHTGLEGVWMMQTMIVGTDSEPYPEDLVAIKFYVYPRFAWAHYNKRTRRFIATGGGTYQFDGKQLTEYIDYFTYPSDLIKPGTRYELVVSLNGNTYTQKDLTGYEEKWQRIK